MRRIKAITIEKIGASLCVFIILIIFTEKEFKILQSSFGTI
jgi:hypothetical protein